MKTYLALFSTVAAIGAPTALAAEAAGVALPSALNANHVFAAFVAGLVLLTAFADYATPRTRALRPITQGVTPAKASHALAA
jgi:hypothetical protein